MTQPTTVNEITHGASFLTSVILPITADYFVGISLNAWAVFFRERGVKVGAQHPRFTWDSVALPEVVADHHPQITRNVVAGRVDGLDDEPSTDRLTHDKHRHRDQQRGVRLQSFHVGTPVGVAADRSSPSLPTGTFRRPLGVSGEVGPILFKEHLR